MKKLRAALAVLATGVAISAIPVRAITDGGFDNDNHPYVGVIS